MLRVETEGAVATITLARPEVKNALDDQLIAALSAAFSHLGPDIRAVVLTGDGNAFCAGGDLQWMRRAANYTEEENYRDAVKLAELFRAIVECPAVVIANYVIEKGKPATTPVK